MNTNNAKKNPGLLWSLATNRCPHCREGKLFTDPNAYNFKHTMDMPEHCPVCGQKYELQVGFYYGTGYVSYFLCVGIIILSFIAWFFTIGMGLHDNRIYWWLASVSVLLLVIQPVLQRWCRSIWIAFFVRYDKNWRNK